MAIDRRPAYPPFGHLVRLSRTCPFSIVDLVSRYLFSYLDRSALANASIFGFRTDLSLSSVQYNLISTVSDLIPFYNLLRCSIVVLTYQIFFIVRLISNLKLSLCLPLTAIWSPRSTIEHCHLLRQAIHLDYRAM